ncbi:MAG: hypothetical protein PVJ21_15055 [Anaerolineales bacterium]|jgi:hypothetical protein
MKNKDLLFIGGLVANDLQNPAPMQKRRLTHASNRHAQRTAEAQAVGCFNSQWSEVVKV